MNKRRALQIHLWPSISLLLVIAGLVYFAWFPYPFLKFTDPQKFSLLLIMAAGISAPLLTMLVYVKDKRGLILDLSVIVLIQILAIGWGTFTLYQARPYFMVFALDRFEIIAYREIDNTKVLDENLLDKPFTGPVVLYASMPTDTALFQQLLQEVMFEGKADLQFRPEFWSLYLEKMQLVPAVARPLQLLLDARPESAPMIEQFVAHNGGDINHLLFVPVTGNQGESTAIINAQDGRLLASLLIDPWVK